MKPLFRSSRSRLFLKGVIFSTSLLLVYSWWSSLHKWRQSSADKRTRVAGVESVQEWNTDLVPLALNMTFVLPPNSPCFHWTPIHCPTSTTKYCVLEPSDPFSTAPYPDQNFSNAVDWIIGCLNRHPRSFAFVRTASPLTYQTFGVALTARGKHSKLVPLHKNGGVHNAKLCSGFKKKSRLG